MNMTELAELRQSEDRRIQELLSIYDAALDWTTEWDGTKPAKGTLERALFDAVQSVVP